MEIMQYETPNKTTGRAGYKPDMIVCHITEGSFNGAVSWLCNKASNASTHYIVAKDGRVAQLVSLRDTAWGNGTSTEPRSNVYYGNSGVAYIRTRKTNANFYSISIEHEGFYNEGKGALTDLQLQSTTELIRHIRAEVRAIYGTDIPLDRDHIVGHCDVTPLHKPNCPGRAYPFGEILRILKEDEEMVERTKISINGQVIEADRVLKQGCNFVKLQDLKQAGVAVDYDEKNNMPLLIFPANVPTKAVQL